MSSGGQAVATGTPGAPAVRSETTARIARKIPLSRRIANRYAPSSVPTIPSARPFEDTRRSAASRLRAFALALREVF